MKTIFQILFLTLSIQFLYAQNANSGIGLPSNLNPDATLHIYGTGVNGAGSRLIFGDDLGSFSGVRVYVGEYGWQNIDPVDSDILELHGEKGIKFSFGYDPSIPKIPFEITNTGFTKIHMMDTIITSAYNVVRQDDGTLAVRGIHKIGDIAFGGIIFWLDETGEHGLVVAPSDQDPGIIWSSNFGTITSASGDGIGAGFMNSLLIVSENRTGNSAAKICTNLGEGSYGDWYLPSKSELGLMYQNLYLQSLGNFAKEGYWSSTETISGNVWFQNFNDGVPDLAGKISLYNVRAIRKF